MLLFFIFTAFIIFSHVILVNSVFHQAEETGSYKKENLEDFLFFFLGNIFDMLVETVFQHQSLGNLDTSTFLSREMIIYSYTLLPVIKPFPYLRQNIFHNNKETHYLKFLDHL